MSLLFFSTIFVTLSRFFKFSFIVGSKSALFSAANIIGPMTGILGGFYNGLAVYLIQFLTKLIFSGNLFLALGYHIPHLFASFYWKSESKIARILIPLMCMFLFILNPVGAQAWLYSMLWLIPMVISLQGHSNIFLRALGSTFTAHAIGSVIWIYSVSMQAEIWLSLIPVAIVERVLFASGMVLIYYAYHVVKNYNFSVKRMPFVRSF